MRLNRTTAVAAAAVAALSLTPASAAEQGSDLPAKGWSVSGTSPQEYEFGTAQIDGVHCAFIKARTPSPPGFGTLGQVIAAGNYHDQRLRLSAQMKTDNAARAQLWMRVDGPSGKMLGFYNMGDKPVVGTTEWKRYDVVLDVPSDAVEIAFGYFLSGSGIVWAKDIKLEAVNKDVPVSSFPDNPVPRTPANMSFDE